jgi:putative ABC transport system permease protein
MESAAKVALIGSTVANNVFPGQDPVGRYIRVNRVPLNVIGVLEPKGQTPQGQDQDDMVLVPLDTARKRILGDAALSGQSVGNILLKVRSSEEVGQAEEDARRVLKVRHRWRPGQDEDFTIRNLSQFLEARAQAVRIMSLLLMAVASISLVVGGIGIMNIMLVSVTERTREIGLRMALGARGRDILAQFLIEAVTLSLIGGAIGITLGILGSFLVARLASFPAVLGIKSMFLAFGFSAAVGVFFGYYPAHKASRLNPIEALRYE